MFKSVRVGKLFGIPIFIHPTFLLLPAWVVLTNPGVGSSGLALMLVGVVAVFGCVVLHELGHALTARRFGIATRDITLYPIGGVARLERMSEKPLEEVLIALAGPAVNLVIVLLLTPAVFLGVVALSTELLTFSTGAGLVHMAMQFLILLWLSNMVLLVFNLVPCFPMDGGRVLRALLSRRLGQVRATQIASGISIPFALLIAAWGLYYNNPITIVVAAFVVIAGRSELAAIRLRDAQRQSRAFGTPEPVAGPRPLTLSAEAPAPAELNAAFSGYTWHRDFRVWVLWREGRPVAFWRAGAAE
jgi:Zn-dependent protease